MGALARFVAWFLFVPPEPEPPFGSPGSAQVFRASERYFRYRIVLWSLGQLYGAAMVGGMSFVFRLIANDPKTPPVVATIFTASWIAFAAIYVIALVLSFAAQRISYEMRWYIVTDRSLRIREGVWLVKEMTLTFANVQEVSIEQGPIERALGIANLRVRTAGGGGARSASGEQAELHVGVLRGIDNAAEVRDLVLARMKAAKSAGLGDPDDRPRGVDGGPAGEDSAPATALHAAREARAAAAALRSVAERLAPRA